MATESQKKRKELREKRLAAEQQAKGQDKRQNVVKVIAAVAFVAVVAVVAAIVVLTSGSDEPTKSDGAIEKSLKGIPQQGTVLGQPDAPVTLIEFGDLQCPACRQFAETTLPDLIESDIKTGKAKIEFRNWPILGPDSNVAGQAALAASLQGRYWEFIEYFYANQGAEGTGYINDEFLTDVAEQAGVEDIDKWNADRNLPRWEEQFLKTDEEAILLEFSGTPSFAIQVGDGELQPVEDGSLEGLQKAIAQASG